MRFSEYNKNNLNNPNVTYHERVGPLETAFGCLAKL